MKELESSPFYALFTNYPWLPFVLMSFRRQLGMWSEFIEVHAKPFTVKK